MPVSFMVVGGGVLGFFWLVVCWGDRVGGVRVAVWLVGGLVLVVRGPPHYSVV